MLLRQPSCGFEQSKLLNGALSGRAASYALDLIGSDALPPLGFLVCEAAFRREIGAHIRDVLGDRLRSSKPEAPLDSLSRRESLDHLSLGVAPYYWEFYSEASHVGSLILDSTLYDAIRFGESSDEDWLSRVLPTFSPIVINAILVRRQEDTTLLLRLLANPSPAVVSAALFHLIHFFNRDPNLFPSPREVAERLRHRIEGADADLSLLREAVAVHEAAQRDPATSIARGIEPLCLTTRSAVAAGRRSNQDRLSPEGEPERGIQKNRRRRLAIDRRGTVRFSQSELGMAPAAH